MKRLFKILGGLLAVLAALVIALLITVHHSPTVTTPGPDAEALAHTMLKSVDADAWARTGAVRWRFANHQHLWDRTRGLERVRWGDHEVLLDLATREGSTREGGREITERSEHARLLAEAYGYFINDMFWLNPVVKAFDPGTSRAIGRLDGKRALLVSYASGGLTPGDRYLWILDDNGRPERWRLWVKILKVGGVEITWQGWQKLATGAWVATEHRLLGLDLIPVRDVAGAATLSALVPGPDPFAALVRR
ncbi:MAG: hypothetical protein ACHQ17_07390 [Polyangia bacterium]